MKLEGIPFEAGYKEKIDKALSELNDRSYKLVRSTYDKLFYDFNGEEKDLKRWFDKYYSTVSWNEIINKYGEYNDQGNQSKQKDELLRIIKDLFVNSVKGTKYNSYNISKKNQISFNLTIDNKYELANIIYSWFPEEADTILDSVKDREGFRKLMDTIGLAEVRSVIQARIRDSLKTAEYPDYVKKVNYELVDPGDDIYYTPVRIVFEIRKIDNNI